MLNSKDTQFSLSPTGEILWQEKINNPMPGVLVARLSKGQQALLPEITLVDRDDQAILNHLKVWLTTHISAVLESLVLLAVPQGMETKEDAVSKIAARVYDGMGIVQRSDLEDVIAELTPETRADLRVKKIRLGPVLAFMPELNKPAAVRLRALLWSIYHDSPLPAAVPNDGIVSVRVEEGNAVYYRAIGYPLYGKRAVRIDMLDRVISCVYDHAKDGKFQARHEMAEWLGSSIPDLYDVLEAMGHTKIYDPAEQEQIESEEGAEKPEKPELATFRLKKGKASDHSSAGKKPFKAKPKKTDKKKKPSKPKRDNSPRVVSAEAKIKAEDNPFAILGQLKK